MSDDRHDLTLEGQDIPDATIVTLEREEEPSKAASHEMVVSNSAPLINIASGALADLQLPRDAPLHQSHDVLIDIPLDTSSSGLKESQGSIDGSQSQHRGGWSVKGLLSTLRDKVQEPSDASTPKGKFYFDSVNMFQGFQDLEDSDSDSESESSPRFGHKETSSSNPINNPVYPTQGEALLVRGKGASKTPNRRRRADSLNFDLTVRVSEPRSESGPRHGELEEEGSGEIKESNSETMSNASSSQRNKTPLRRRNSAGARFGSSLPLDWREDLVPLELEEDEQLWNEGEKEAHEARERDRETRQARRLAKNKWYYRLWRQIQRQQTWVFLLILGLTAALLGLTMEQTMHLLIEGRNKLANITTNYFVNYMLWVLFAMASCTLATALVHFVAPYAAGSGIPAVKSILSGVMMEHYLSFRTMTIKVLGLICVYAAGMFVGKEGPYVHISTALASQLARLPFFERIQRNEGLKLQLFAAGCAAGVAVTFGAPIGGVIFSIEVTSTYYLIQNLNKGFFCAIVATLFVHLLDTQGLIAFFSTDFAPAPYTSSELVAFSLIGISFGLLGVLFNLFVKKISQLRRNYKILSTSRYGQVLVVAALSALVTFPILPLRTGPSSVLNDLFSNSPLTRWTSPNIYFTLSAVVILEFIMCGISVGLPIPCGLYTPLFILGAALGRLIGEVLQSIHILPNIVPAGYAVVGAAAFAAGTTRTLSSSIICFELTRQLEHLLPVLLAVLIASAVGNFFGPSIYDELLKLKGLPYMPPFRTHASKTARSIMRTDVLFIPSEATFEDLQNLLIRSHYSSFPLVLSSSNKTLLGVLQRSILERTLEKLETRLQALAERQVEFLNVAMEIPESGLAAGTPGAPASNDPQQPKMAPNFRSHFGGKAASLILEANGHMKTESQQLQSVLREMTESAMKEVVGFGRHTIGLDPGPFQFPVQTPGSKVHFLFAMLGMDCGYVLDQGQLVGVITKRDLINLE